MKKFGEKEAWPTIIGGTLKIWAVPGYAHAAWAYPGTAQIFRVPPIISGTGKDTDFKFGQYI